MAKGSGDNNAQELAKREERLFSKKSNIDALNQEIAYNFYPQRADFLGTQALGEEYCEDIFDSQPILARRDLGNARASMLRPRGQQWFRQTIKNKEIAERPLIAQHLDWMTEQTRSALYRHRAGFVDAMKQVDNDVVSFGNAVHSFEASRTETAVGLLFRCWHLRDCVWLDDEDGVMQDYLARRFKSSARHIKKKFPQAKLHQDIVAALEDNPDMEFRLCHTVLPVDEYEFYGDKREGTGGWASVYYDSQHRMILRERRLPFFPYRVSRWEKMSGSQYAISPAALTSLPDGRGMQVIMRVLLESGEKALDPPLKATQGAVVGEINNFGGGITWVKADYDERLGPAMEMLAPRTNPPSGIELRMMMVHAMREEWYLNSLKLPTQAKTAYETAQLVEEFIRANIPLFEPWEADTEATLEGAVELMLLEGMYGPMREWPSELSEIDVEFEFSNPLQDAIERNKVNQATQIFGLTAAAKQADPAMPNVFDNVKVLQDAGRATGGPADWLLDMDAVRAKEAQTEQQGNIVGALQQAGAAADIVHTGSEAAANLQEVNQPAAGGSFAYGPS